ncbi:polysaccharide biosynthesis protein [Flavobacterium enshiense DK69]|uniref:Polysaccharide biosynthesis protein n=1 Tax=Flavobacterium enshiense DK69 TaxID=1107311 RepID=V6SD95_9FLAO|nr:oligosaccharide flippase family protein [Flavobacterium enshiense]ESU24212.1 polysaccharide biosynthesis protein [Flavobacterium enshiense DK69]KGO95411.1 polysaccharide biosynthesis protein [Flavobacterium enshiense DK69]
MSLYKNLFKQTFIYGIATVLPRMLSFLLVRLYTDLMPRSEYGEVTVVLSWMVFFNVILSYGMETAFFRFYNKEENKKSVIETTTISIFWTSISFLSIALLFRNTLANWAGVEIQYVTYAIWILVFDALAIIPFSKLRATQRPMKYAVIKIGNVVVNLGLNIFFLLVLPKLAQSDPESFWSSIFIYDFQVGYIFVANLIASLATLLVFLPDYIFLKWHFNISLWKNMMHYGWPILFAGLAFGINEHFDKILLEKLLPQNIALSEVGAYSACYKLGLFMVLFRTAYTLGIEPFFFSHAGNENAPQTYATVTKYFVIFGSLILLCVVVFADVLKVILIGNPEYWEAMKVVPLIILANFFLGIYTNLSVWYKLIDKTQVGAYISVLGAIVTLALNFLLIPKFSYMGSAIATLAAYGSMMAISYYLGNKHYPIPYDKKRIFGYLGVSTLLSGLSFYVDVFRESYIFGIVAILIFTYFIYHNEKETLLRVMRRKVA